MRRFCNGQVEIHAVNPEVGERLRVVVGERLRGEPRDETLVVPDLEVTLLAKHVDFAGHLRAVTQPRLNQHAPLRIELGDLAVKIHAIEKTLPRGMRGGDLREPALELDPDRHRIDAYGLARQARDEQLWAVIFLNHGAKCVRNLEPALIINFRRRVAPEHAD